MKILIVVDMQEDFVNGSLGTPEAKAIVPAVVKKIRDAALNGAHIIYTFDSHRDDYLTTSEGKHLPVEHCIMGTPGWELVEEVAMATADIVNEGLDFNTVYKPNFGSADQLPEVINRVIRCNAVVNPEDTKVEIELCGLCSDICVVSNALILKANYPEFPVSVDAQAVAGVTPESNEAALTVMRMCQVEVFNDKA